MITQRRIRINLEPLRINTAGNFVVRFSDTSDSAKLILATRIKETAKQARIRNTNGPSIETIYNALEEINPIIFGEQINGYGYNRRTHKTFGTYNARFLTGYWFNLLTQSVYIITCLKRELYLPELLRIGRLTSIDWMLVENTVHEFSRNVRIQEIEDGPSSIPEEIGLEELNRISTRIEQNNRIPDAMFEEEPVERIITANTRNSITFGITPSRPMWVVDAMENLTNIPYQTTVSVNTAPLADAFTASYTGIATDPWDEEAEVINDLNNN